MTGDSRTPTHQGRQAAGERTGWTVGGIPTGHRTEAATSTARAGGGLSREPPPVGSGFWLPVHGIDGERLWRGALTALVAGLAPPPR
jgi:hypothetical protein